MKLHCTACASSGLTRCRDRLSKFCCCCCKNGGCSRACCYSYAGRCCRVLIQRVPWKRVIVVVVLASLVSAVFPGAPLQRLLLSADAERERLLAENEQRLQYSQQFLDNYRNSLDDKLKFVHPDKKPVEKQKIDDDKKKEEEQQQRLEEAILFQPLHPPNEDRLHINDDFFDDDDDARATKDNDWPLGRRRVKGGPVDIAVTVLTMARGRRLTATEKTSANYSTQYLTQSVARLLELMQDPGLERSYSLTICNVDDHPEDFQEARDLEDLLPVFWRYGNPDSHAEEEEEDRTVKEEKAEEAGRSVWEKLKWDYVYCLQNTLSSGANYALLIEDDAVAHAHLFRVLEYVLRVRVERERTRNPVAYIKLYHPSRLLSYISPEPERLLELLSVSSILGAVVTFLLSACNRRHGSRRHQQYQQSLGSASHGVGSSHSHSIKHPHSINRPHQFGVSISEAKSKTAEKSLFYGHQTTSSSNSSQRTRQSSQQLFWTWLGWSLTVGAFVLAVGRANLLELRRISPQLYQVSPVPSCCIPAVLYSRQGGTSFADFLSNVTCTRYRSTDIRMDEWRRSIRESEGARGLMIQPGLFSHIGLLSSLRTKEVNPLIVQ